MDLQTGVRLLRSRWRLIVLGVLTGALLGALSSLLMTPSFESKAQLFVGTSQTTSDTGSALNQGGQFAQQRVKSYAAILNSPLVTEPVVQELGLPVTPAALSRQITAVAPLDTVLIDVTVRDDSAVRAERIANAVASRFTQVVAGLETPDGSATSTVKVTVVRAAGTPTSPVSPRALLNLALGLLVGLAVGVALAVLRETLDTTLKGGSQLQELLGAPTLGTIVYDPEAVERPLIVQASPHSTRAEAFRQLRTNLQFVNVDVPPRSIVMTSALPQEGKSTTACNLAVTLAQAGLRVALVEADLRRPRLAEYLGIEGAVGLTDVLVGRADLDDVLQPWGADGLLVLPSGPTPPNPSELLGSKLMHTLLATLEERTDLVIIDAPPILPVTDAAILAKQASGTIVVLRAGKTTRDQARRAVDILRQVDAQIYGLVLNMVPSRGPDATAYGYGYGYGYASTQVQDPDTLSSDGVDGQPGSTGRTPVVPGPRAGADEPAGVAGR